MRHLIFFFLRKFVLVFFDDILVYSKSWARHLEHLKIVFSMLNTHQLHVKLENANLVKQRSYT